ncbi:helix-turn-helix domain-containing protein [Streptomyces lividans]
MDVQQLAEYRYRTVREVLGGSPIGEVAARYGTSRQTLHTWRRRFVLEGMPGLLDRSRRPRNSPARLSAEVEAEICELRRRHPMHLWQVDLVGGVPLADGRECKMVTGVDDAPEPELSIEVVEPPALPPQGTAVEFKVRVPPSGEITLVTGRQRVGIHQALAGRTLTVWANHRSVHFLDGHPVTTVPSRLRPEDLAYLTMRYGARPAGPEPAPAALPRARSGTAILAAGEPVEVDRKVHRDGIVHLASGRYQVGFALASGTITLRLDGHLMHAIADDALTGTWPCPVPADRLGQIEGPRTATSPLPPPPLPAGAFRAQRKVHASGRFMINGQSIKLGPRHAGKLVTVVIEDTHYQSLHGEDELAVRPRKNREPITRLYVKGMGTQQGPSRTS